MELRKKISVIALLAVAISVLAVPARRDGHIMTAPDGTEKLVFMHGNEDFHYLTDENGVWLDENTLAPMSGEKKANRLAVKREKDIRRAVQQTGADRLLAPKGPVILVNFSDESFTHTLDEMTAWVTGEDYHVGGSAGSIREYFYDNSFGQYDLQLDVYGPVTVSQGYAYYGQNRGNVDGADMHPGEMVIEACRAADAMVDFSQYDYNNDGEVDWVVIVYAGKGEADSYIANTIWPHQHQLYSSAIQLDGKRINRYCCTNEIDGYNPGGALAGIGVFVHEFSHIMGLPDLYTTNHTDHKTLGMWDIMDYGCYNDFPPMYSAYERWWMGWLEPTLLHQQAANISLGELSNTQQAYYITANGDSIANILSPSPSVFYMLENRQQSSWDTYLPGHGMLITKINWSYSRWTGNAVNNSSTDMGVDILEADGLAPEWDGNMPGNGYHGKQGDTYPSGANSFTQLSGYQLTDITETNGLITLKVNGGTATEIIETEEDNYPARKILRNGQILILRGNNTYTLLGHENHQL